jgi:hypothetical protein
MNVHKVRAVAIQPIEMLRSMNGSNGEAALQHRVGLAKSAMGRLRRTWLKVGRQLCLHCCRPRNQLRRSPLGQRTTFTA